MTRITKFLNIFNTSGTEPDKARLQEVLRELRRFSALPAGQMARVQGGKRLKHTEN